MQGGGAEVLYPGSVVERGEAIDGAAADVVVDNEQSASIETRSAGSVDLSPAQKATAVPHCVPQLAGVVLDDAGDQSVGKGGLGRGKDGDDGAVGKQTPAAKVVVGAVDIVEGNGVFGGIGELGAAGFLAEEDGGDFFAGKEIGEGRGNRSIALSRDIDDVLIVDFRCAAVAERRQ